MVTPVMINGTRFGSPGLLVVLLLAGSPIAALAQDVLQMRTNYYAVTGTSLAELRRSLDQSRPRRGTGPHDGLTVWDINWKIGTHQRGGQSRVSSFATQTKITLTLPQWTAPTNTAPDVLKAWQKYSAALQAHEQGHVQLVRVTLTELHAQVRTVSAGSDAQALRQQVEDLARSIVSAGDARHENYDRLTRHGETQGARLSAERRAGRARPETSAAGY